MKNTTIVHFVGCAVLLGTSLGAAAQAVYRIVDAEGNVTFSDKPPINPQQGKVTTTGAGAAGTGASQNLPFELRQVASKYPVILYSAPKCTPCDMGRSFLSGRGIPFSERTVSSAEDIDAFQRLSGDTSLPSISVGGQRVKGFSSQEWAQYLDAAGYPATSTLPASYKNPAATPLVIVHKPTDSPTPKAEERPAAPAPTPSPTTRPAANPNNPAGIVF